MKILFIYPRFVKYLEEENTASIGKFNNPPGLAIPILSSITPKKHTVEFINDNLESIDYETDADLIALSFFTPQATRAYEICREFRRRGKKTVVGGMHPSVCCEEAMSYADIVCVGEGENCWLEILKDLEKGVPKKLYTSSQTVQLNEMPIPDRSIYYKKKELYNFQADIVQVMRGCKFPCPQCVIPPIFGNEMRLKDFSKIMEDIMSLEFDIFYLADDQIFYPMKISNYADTLFGHIRDLGIKKQILINTAPSLTRDKKLLELMADAGVSTFYSVIGFDPISKNGLLRGRKNLRKQIIDQVKMVEDTGMVFVASFPLGLEEHDEKIEEILLQFCTEARIKLAEFFMFTPLPGTPVWKQMEKENRILHHNWEQFNGGNVVFQPKNMSPERLTEIYQNLWKEFRRLSGSLSYSYWINTSNPSNVTQ